MTSSSSTISSYAISSSYASANFYNKMLNEPSCSSNPGTVAVWIENDDWVQDYVNEERRQQPDVE